MRAGRAIRQDRALEHASAKPCDGCGHRTGDHRELKPKIVFRDGVLTEIPHPDYKPLEFHCTVEGCSCVMGPLE